MGEQIVDAFIDFGEIDIAASGMNTPPCGVTIPPNTEAALVGQPQVRCSVRSLVWPVQARSTARLVEDWDDRWVEHGDFQAVFGQSEKVYDGPRWRAGLTPADRAEVRFRSTAYVLCQPALMVEESRDVYSDMPQRHRMLLPLRSIGMGDPPGATAVAIAHPDTVFRGFRLLCDPVAGSLDSVAVEAVIAGNVSLFAGDGLVMAGVFHPSVSPDFHWPTLHSAQRVNVILRNLGPEPVRLRLRVEGKGLEKTGERA